MNTILIVLAILGAAFWLYRTLSKPADKPNKNKTNTDNAKTEYRSVEIVPGMECCRPALNLRGKMFLMEQAPRLPLANCSNPEECKCKFVRYPDRRRGKRRANVFAAKQVAAGHTPKAESRKTRGRRNSDHKT